MKKISFSLQILKWNFSRQCFLCRTPVNSSVWAVGFNNLNGLKKEINYKTFRRLYSSEKKLEIFDEKPNEKPVIYYGTLTGNMKGVKVFTLITSVGGIIAQAWLWQNASAINNLPFQTALLICIGFFSYGTPFLIHSVCKKYVTEIRYDSTSDTYTATVLSFFLRKVNINFKREDVHIPAYQPLFATMTIKGRPLLISSDCFFDVQDYIKMMGYDKPIDLHLSPRSDSAQKTARGM